MEKFESSSEVIKATMVFLELMTKLDYSKLSSHEKDYVFSQYKRIIGKIVICINKNG